MKQIVTPEKEKEIIDTYKTNTLRMTAIKCKVGQVTAQKVLVKNNITLHTPEEDAQIKTENHKLSISNMSLETKKLRRDRISAAVKLAYKNYTPEQKTLFSEARSRAEASKSEEFKKQIVEKGRQTQKANWDKKSDYEKKLHALKTSIGLTNRTASEKQRTENLRQMTYLTKYGVKNPLQNKDILQKKLNTQKANNTFNKSKDEDLYYQALEQKYAKVIRQYSSEKYPFACDFYIPSEDLFIELNLSWTHGKHPFNENNPEDLQLLESWKEKAKASKYYENAIKTWTERDIAKLKIAKENNLNYKTIYIDEWQKIKKEIKV